MITVLRASGTDENVANATSAFVSIPQPLGVRDGDLLIVAIALPRAGLTVTPPSDEWIKIEQSDKRQDIGIVAFYKTALNEPRRWVFALSSVDSAVGGVLVYGNADSFEPIEVCNAALTPAGSNNHNVSAVAMSVNEEESIYLLAANAQLTYTPIAGYQQAFSKSQSIADAGVCTLAAHHRLWPAAGTRAANTVHANTPAQGASLALVLRPGFGTLTVDDVRERIVESLPRGVDEIYDLTPTGDYYKLFQALAEVGKFYLFDIIDLLRREIIPSSSRYKLPDWESFFGLLFSRVTKLGTIPQRQAQIVAELRAMMGQGSSIPVVKAVLGPLLGYAVGTDVQVLEADRSDLQLQHSYSFPNDLTLKAGTPTNVYIRVHDGGLVSSMGAQIQLAVLHGDLSLYSVTLTAPDGRSKTWASGWSAVPLVIYAKELAGASIHGNWLLSVTNGSGIDNTLYSSTLLFVEGMPVAKVPRKGIAPRQNTAGAVFHWGVYADPAHLGENGTSADFSSARRAIRKLRFSHTIANLIQSLSPWPDTASGAHAAIPDECIPV